MTFDIFRGRSSGPRLAESAGSSFIRFRLRVLVIPIVALLLQSCTPPPPVDPFTFSDEGIQIELKADHQLNSYDGQAHTIKLAIYQLSNNSAFQEQTANQEGIRKLLNVGKFDPSVLSFKQMIVKPNDARLLVLDRAAGAKWVGIVAGYFTSQDQTPPFACIEIPIKSKRKSVVRRVSESAGLLAPLDNRYVPAMLIQLVLTPETMYETSAFR
jgi:type VI secretion system VasD/TssJ family lipoprotein